MCVIFATIARRRLPCATERANAWTRNPDGGGIMWSDGGKLHIVKGLMTNEDMELALAEVPAAAPVVLHYRIGTAGGNTPDNTHPFLIRRGVAMCHNGILAWPDCPGMSDTRCMVDDLLKHIPTSVYWDKNWLEGMGQLIGANNKLVFMDALGNISIVNAQSGTKEKGVWYSNTHHRFHPLADRRSLIGPAFYAQRRTFADIDRDEAAVDRVAKAAAAATGPGFRWRDGTLTVEKAGSKGPG